MARNVSREPFGRWRLPPSLEAPARQAQPGRPSSSGFSRRHVGKPAARRTRCAFARGIPLGCQHSDNQIDQPPLDKNQDDRSRKQHGLNHAGPPEQGGARIQQRRSELADQGAVQHQEKAREQEGEQDESATVAARSAAATSEKFQAVPPPKLIVLLESIIISAVGRMPQRQSLAHTFRDNLQLLVRSRHGPGGLEVRSVWGFRFKVPKAHLNRFDH